MFYAISEAYTSLNQLSHESKFTHHIEISKQGLHDKFSAGSVSFSKQLLSEALSHQIRLVPANADKELFGRVLVLEKDVFIGTAEKLPVRLVIALVPEEVYQSRIRKRNKKNKNIGKTRTSTQPVGK
jgi:hypothetical protein